MKLRTKITQAVVVATMASTLLFSCKKDKDEPTPSAPAQKTIVELAVANGFDSLAVALTQTGLLSNFDQSTDPKTTVFAPTNEAFVNLLGTLKMNKISDIPNDILTQVLLYHVVDGSVLSTNLSEGMVIKTLSGSTLRASLSGGAMLYTKATESTNITGTDILASNGVIHVIDEVLVQDAPGLPGNTTTVPTKTIATTAVDGGFDSLVVALTRLNLVSTFNDADARFTVFAPTNQAFVDLCAALNVTSIAAIDLATLTATIQYHAVDGIVTSNQLVNDLKLPTLNTAVVPLTVDLTSGVKIKDLGNGLSAVSTADVWCTNGIVHVIDRVLLPLSSTK
jgi:uncharacterized surface protein with fasciclin (FAS1) repeats